MIRLLDEELDTLTTTDDSNQLLCNLCQATKFQHVLKFSIFRRFPKKLSFTFPNSVHKKTVTCFNFN